METEIYTNESTTMKSEFEAEDLPERVIGSSGLRKKILRKGVSWQTPTPGDEIEVHYTLSLENGGFIDSSREKETPFRFRLGQGEVIKGWDDGVATMRKGERAVFTIPPELAYGDIGSPPMVPPNSALISEVEVILWYPVRDISGDGGIIKKIIREGEGWATPNEADEVLVKYVMKDESRNIITKSDEAGLEFSLLKGHLCPAMSKAVKTMRKGEKAELSVKFCDGLRHCRNETFTEDVAILSNPNLVIHMELVSWKSVIDITGDKKILKKITRVGEGYDRPNDESLVKVIYTAKLEDGTVLDRKGSDSEPFEYTCGEEQIDELLDRAIMTMRKGEEASVTVSSDISGASQPGESISVVLQVSYEVKLIDFTKEIPFWKMDIRERMEACESKKHDGNLLFKAGKFKLASKKYEKERKLGTASALKILDYNHSFSHEEKLQANSLKLPCYLNNAACKLKLAEYSEVSRLCTKVLELDPFNVKALFRRTEAYIRTSDLEKAEEDIKRALALEPGNRDVKIKHRELQDIRRRYVQQETTFFSTMVSRIR